MADGRIGTCKTCRHWKKPAYDFGAADSMCRPVDPDTYEPMERTFMVAICKHPEQTFCEAPLSADGFGLADGSQYMALLATGEAFGCVRWEAATPPKSPS